MAICLAASGSRYSLKTKLKCGLCHRSIVVHAVLHMFGQGEVALLEGLGVGVAFLEVVHHCGG